MKSSPAIQIPSTLSNRGGSSDNQIARHDSHLCHYDSDQQVNYRKPRFEHFSRRSKTLDVGSVGLSNGLPRNLFGARDVNPLLR
jgi:hypothetical protein